MFISYDLVNLCGNFTTYKGTVLSPNYPEHYPPNHTCLYMINVESGRNIVLNVEDFETEDRHDWLVIYNGSTSDSPLLANFSGSPIPSSYRASNHVMMEFHSDLTTSNRGFKISYKSLLEG